MEYLWNIYGDIYIEYLYDILIWLVVEPYPSEKYESLGIMKFPTEWKNKKMYRITNQ